jgi:hypothetical protein
MDTRNAAGKPMNDADLPVGTLRTPTQTRAWTRNVEPKTRPRKQSKRGVQTAGPVLIFDTETKVDAAQALTFGSWRFGIYAPGGALTLLEEGLFHADNLADTDPEGFAHLTTYAATHPADVDRNAPGANPTLALISRREFAVVLFRAIQANALIINFNKPFDLSRIAIAAGAARGKRYGGFSLRVWENEYSRPRITLKMVNSKSSFTDLTWPPKIPLKNGTAARLLDLRTLGFALDATPYTLASACRKWNVTNPKQSIEEHGRITPDYIAYNLADTRATAELCAKMFFDLEKHPIEAKPEHLMSPASLAKSYLRAMGVQPRMSVQPDFPEPILGAAMSTFYGGRAECRIRRTPMPVEVHDFTSMYPTVNTLMGLWAHHTAERIEVIDSTAELTEWLSTLTLETLFNPKEWLRLAGLAQIDAAGDILPVRARYGLKGDRNATIGVNPYWSGGPQWFTIADIVASTLLTGRVPTILTAITIRPVGTLPGLQAVRLSGDIRIDPGRDDFFKAVIEKRVPVKDQPLGAFLKVLANSGSYGIFAQFDRADLAPGTDHLLLVEDGAPADATGGSSYLVTTDHPETPGPFAFPPVAAVITGGARLMLAMLERCITDTGGSWVFGDTDSMAIVSTETGGLIACPGGDHQLADGKSAVRALSFDQTLAIRNRFDRDLNPYNCDLVPELLKSEYRGMCFAISAKRYACYTIEDGCIVVDHSKVSEHGLGHLMDPTLDRLPGAQERNAVHSWVIAAWEWIIARETGLHVLEPDWLDRPAVGRFNVTSTHLWRAFDTYNAGRQWADQVKPANFLLTIGINTLGGDHGRLVAPYEPDPALWDSRNWYRLSNGHPVMIDTAWDGDANKALVETFRDVLLRHVAHPEAKFLTNTGQPCLANTRGLLQRRPTISTGRETIGKEANLIEEAQSGMLTDDPTPVYRHTSTLWTLTARTLQRSIGRQLTRAIQQQRQQLSAENAATDASICELERQLGTGLGEQQNSLERQLLQAQKWRATASERHPTLSQRQISRIIADGVTPRQSHMREFLIAFAVSAAANELELASPERRWEQERNEIVLEAYLALPDKLIPCTCGCGVSTAGRTRWANDACRKRFARGSTTKSV